MSNMQMTIPGIKETTLGNPVRGKWPMVKLSHLFEKPISGEWGDEATEEDSTAVGVLRTTNFSKDYRIKTSSEIVLRKIDLPKVEKKKLIFGDVIIEKSGGSPTQPVGRVVFYDLDRGDTLCNNFTSILRPKQITFPKYACYALFSLHQNGSTLKFQNKTTGIINLKLERYLEDIKIPLPPLPEQQRIVARLDKAQQLIDQRKEQLALMDALVQSLFYEMFGDPVKNEKGWAVQSLGKISIVGTGSTPSREELERFYENGKFPWVKTTEVNGNDIYSTEEKITQIAIDETNCKLFPPNTILLAMYGQGKTRGQVGLLKIHAATNQACAAIKCFDSVDYRFVYKTLSMLYSFIRSLARGGNQENLNLSIVKDIPIILPPLPLQQTFADRVQQIEALKQSMTASLRELEQNFQALMQEAFGT